MKFFVREDEPFTVQGTELLAGDTREQSRQKLARITLDSMTHFTGLLDASGMVLEINQVALDAAGLKLPDVEGRPFWTTAWWQVSEEINATLRQAIQRAAEGESVRWDTEIFGRSGSKETITIDASLTPIKDAQGNVVFIAIEGRDITEKKAYEHEIADLRRQAAQREAQLRLDAELERRRLLELLTTMPACIGLLSGPQHRWTYINDHYVRSMGRTSAEEFLGKTVLESMPEIQGQGFVELLDQVRQTGQSFVGREKKAFINRSATGQPEEGYWDFVYQPVSNGDGRVESILVHGVEVTDRVSAQKALRESEQRLRLAQQAARIGAFEWDLITNTNRWTPELEAMHGLLPGSFASTQQAWEQLVHPEDRAQAVKAVELSFQTGNPVESEWRVIWPDGTVHWLAGRWQVFKDESGKPVRVAGVNMDATLRKEAEKAQRLLAAIVESSDDAIASKDLNGIVTSWNKSAERLFGYKAEEIVGQPIMLIIPPEFHSDEPMILGKIRRGERIEHFETVRVTKGGERIEVSLTISPVRDVYGNVIGAAKIVRNITENKKIERALRTTEKLAAAGRLAATVAHEINNPLEAVTNLVYLAKRDTSDGKKVAAHLELASRELDRVAHIARQTLGFYRDSSYPLRFNVARTMDGLVALYETRLNARKIQVTKQYDKEVEITALEGEIRQAFSNLITNSIDAMPSGGQLLIRISKSRQMSSGQQGVRISILDTGSGIAPKHRHELFQPFFTTKEDVGTGLGLWITRNIIEKHGGDIRMKSRTGLADHGTVCSIFLPAQKSGALAKEARFADSDRTVA